MLHQMQIYCIKPFQVVVVVVGNYMGAATIPMLHGNGHRSMLPGHGHGVDARPANQLMIYIGDLLDGWQAELDT